MFYFFVANKNIVIIILSNKIKVYVFFYHSNTFKPKTVLKVKNRLTLKAITANYEGT